MTAVGRESVEAQILIWLAVALAVAIFVEGLRSTFFRSRHHPFEESEAPSQATVPRVGAPDHVAALARVSRNPQRRVAAVRRQSPLRPGIHRRPPLMPPPEPAFTMELPPETETGETVNADMRLASIEA